MKQQQILRAADYISMPWRNGTGVTREIYRYPAEGEFIWRLSIAQVAEAGGFSHFTGYQRVISVLEGEGIQLDLNGQNTHSLRPFELLPFSGDETVHCNLLGGPIEDFNLIYQPQKRHARCQWLFNSTRQQIVTSATDILLFNTGSECRIENPAHPTAVLNRYDTLYWRNPERSLIALTITATAPCALAELWTCTPSL